MPVIAEILGNISGNIEQTQSFYPIVLILPKISA